MDSVLPNLVNICPRGTALIYNPVSGVGVCFSLQIVDIARLYVPSPPSMAMSIVLNQGCPTKVVEDGIKE